MKVNRIGPNLNNKWSIENVRHLKILNGEDCDFSCLYKIYTVGHLKQVCNDSHALNSGTEHAISCCSASQCFLNDINFDVGCLLVIGHKRILHSIGRSLGCQSLEEVSHVVSS